VKFLLKFLFPILLIFFFNKKLTSIDYETAKEHFDNKEYAEAYQRYNECTNECTSGGKCNKEHFMCMLEIGRMLEKGLAEKNLTKEQRLNKAKFWYKYCSDKGSEMCAQKNSTLEIENELIVKSVQEKLFDLGYPIKRDDIPGIETFTAIKQFQEKESLPIEEPSEFEEWLKLNDMLANAIANKNNNKNIEIGKSSKYGTGVWIGKKNNLFVLTSAHFAKNCKKIRSNIYKDNLSLRLYEIDEEDDLAILESDEIKRNTFIPVNLAKRILEDEKIYIFGYPRQTILNKYDETEGVIKSLKTRKNDRRKIIIQPISNLYPGSSGSPVINENGLMVGTVYGKDSLKKKILDLLRYSTSSEGLYMATSIYTIKSFLDEHNIEYLSFDKSKKKTKEQIINEVKKNTIPLKCD
tara:strand:+ start:22528 stop:23751 length:1224 start_codon:yes stop_codon:yes gene_type:complete